AELKKSLGRITLSATPYGQYYFNRYVSGESRVPSQRGTVGALGKASVAVVRNRLDLVAWGRPAMLFFEEFDDRDSAPSPASQTTYGAYLDLAIVKSV